MTKVLFTPFGVIGGILAGAVGKKAFERLWRMFDSKQAPEPDQRNAAWPKLLAALALEGAIFRAVRGLVDRGARELFSRITGSWPGEQHPESA